MKVIENYNKADITQTKECQFTVDGSLFTFSKIEECKEWIDGVNKNAKTTEFRNGKFVNKSL